MAKKCDHDWRYDHTIYGSERKTFVSRICRRCKKIEIGDVSWRGRRSHELGVWEASKLKDIAKV